MVVANYLPDLREEGEFIGRYVIQPGLGCFSTNFWAQRHGK
jgi:hypothetical protein